MTQQPWKNPWTKSSALNGIAREDSKKIRIRGLTPHKGLKQNPQIFSKSCKADCRNIAALEPSNFMQNIVECWNIATLEPSNFMQNIAECQNIATLKPSNFMQDIAECR